MAEVTGGHDDGGPPDPSDSCSMLLTQEQEAALARSEDDMKFDFEEAICRGEEERLRLLESQGFIARKHAAPSAETGAGNASVGGTNPSAESSSFNSRSRSIVCRHWIRGMCWKGDFCEFLHQYDTGKMPLCRQFLKTGQCPDRDRGTCIFLHERPEDTPVCLHYYLGFCRAGPRCRKRHERLPVEELPQLVPDWYLHLILENAHAVVPQEIDPETEAVIEEVERNCRRLAARGLASPRTPGGRPRLSQPNGKPAASAAMNDAPAGGSLSSSSFSAPRRVSNSLVDDTVLQMAAESGIPRLPPTQSSPRIRVFMIKSSDASNIHKSIRLGIWATGKQNTKLLERAFLDVDHVILLFSANESGGFQGYARMVTPPLPDLHPNLWGAFSVRLGSNFRVQWLKQARVDFERFGRLTNPLNDNQPIRKSRDCQELPVALAAVICTVLDQQPDEDLLEGTPESDKPRIDHSTFFQLSEQGRRKKEVELRISDGMVFPDMLLPPPPQQHFLPERSLLPNRAGPPLFQRDHVSRSPELHQFPNDLSPVSQLPPSHPVSLAFGRSDFLSPTTSAKVALHQRQQQQQHLRYRQQSVKSQPYPHVLPVQPAVVASIPPATYTALRSLPQALQQLRHPHSAPE